MEKLQKIFTSKKFTFVLLFVGATIIFSYYFAKIPQIYIVWELMDEFGYLADAAYLSGNQWPYVTNFYYGYGYSLLLVPLFWICDSGIEVIRGAIAINAIMVVALFFVQYILMSKVCKKLNRNLSVLCSFVLCFYPYIVASGMKVVCEVTLTLVVWLCGLLLYQALDTGKAGYYALLVACAAYGFFVHARSIVFAGVLALTIGILLLFKRINWKQLVAMMITVVLVLALGFSVKSKVIENVYTEANVQKLDEITNVSVEKYTGACRTASALETTEIDAEAIEIINNSEVLETTEEDVLVTEQGEELEEKGNNSVNNLLSPSYIINRIWHVVSNFSIFHIYGFMCRNFYLFVGTLGMFHIGVFVALKDVFSEYKTQKKMSAEGAVKLLFAVAAIMAVLAVIVQAPYSFELPAYNFYGRYYEYIVGPMVFLGLDFCTRKKITFIGSVASLVLLLAFYCGTMNLANYLEIHDLPFDSFRLASISYFTEEYYFRAVVKQAVVTIIVLMLLIVLLNYYKETRILIALLLMALFMNNNEVIEAEILELQRVNYEDLDLVTFIQNYYDVDEVYFLNSGFRYPDAYAGLQPLLHKDDLIVLDGEESDKIQSGELFITFHNNPYIEQMEQSLDFICETTYYELYLVE